MSGPTNTNANKTLVLLNGRRLANHAFDAAAVDLNAIPFAAIDRIEVLRDGASAIYGTDAIGGVINFILKRDLVGLEISAQAVQPQKSGGGDTQRVSLSGGFGSLTNERFNVMAALDWRKQSVLPAVKRDFAKSGIVGAETSPVVPVERASRVTSTVSSPRFRTAIRPVPFRTRPERLCRYDFPGDIDILTKSEQITGLLRGSLAITPDHTASVEYLRANNKSVARVAPVPQNHLMPQSSPFFPAGAPLTAGGIPDLAIPAVLTYRGES